jgi:hypothetical protein
MVDQDVVSLAEAAQISRSFTFCSVGSRSASLCQRPRRASSGAGGDGGGGLNLQPSPVGRRCIALSTDHGWIAQPGDETGERKRQQQAEPIETAVRVPHSHGSWHAAARMLARGSSWTCRKGRSTWSGRVARARPSGARTQAADSKTTSRRGGFDPRARYVEALPMPIP